MDINKYKILDEYIGKELTYRQLCELLGWKYYSGGNSKNAQIDSLYECCKYETKGRGKGLKYIIFEVSNERLNNMNKRRFGNNLKYGMNIETTLMYILHQSEEDHMYFSRGKALELANIVNKNYRVGRREIEWTSKALNIDESYVYKFYEKYNQELIKIFERGLKYMRDRRLIDWMSVTIVAREDANVKLNYLGNPVVEDGHIVGDIEIVHTIATEEERKLILQAERQVLQKMRCATVKEIFLQKKMKYFKKQVEEIIYKQANIKYYYAGYDIIISQTGLKYEVEKDRAILSQMRTNEAIGNKIDKSIETKANKDGNFGGEYAQSMQKLNNTFIRNSTNVKLDKKIDENKESWKQEKIKSEYITVGKAEDEIKIVLDELFSKVS